MGKMSAIQDENQSPVPIPQKCKPVSPFVAKLRLLLQQQKYYNAIRWSQDGRSLVISDIETFKDHVLETEDEMFKTKNFASFVRQLNLYGFRKLQINNAKGDPTVDMHFEHPNFRRDRPDLIPLVHRTCNSAKKRASLRGIHDTYSPKRLRFENDSSMSTVSPLVDRRNEMATPIDIGKSQCAPFQNDGHHNKDRFVMLEVGQKVGQFVSREYGKLSQSHEHDYAIPFLNLYSGEHLDERRMYDYLEKHFCDEITVVQALLSLAMQ